MMFISLAMLPYDLNLSQDGVDSLRSWGIGMSRLFLFWGVGGTNGFAYDVTGNPLTFISWFSSL